MVPTKTTAVGALHPTALQHPNLLLSVGSLVVGLIFLNLNISRLFGYEIPNISSYILATSAGGVAAVPILIPAPIRYRLFNRIRYILEIRTIVAVSVIFCLAAVSSTFATTYRIRWHGLSDVPIVVNGSKLDSNSAGYRAGSNQYSLIGLSGSVVALSVNGYTVSRRLPFLDETIIDIPLHATSNFNPRLSSMEARLLLSFFHLFDRLELLNIKESLDLIRPTNDGDRIAIERLKIIRNLVDNSANSLADISSKRIALDNFKALFPSDPWLFLLDAQIYYGSRMFKECANSHVSLRQKSTNKMINAVESTRLYFRGICKMKAVTSNTITIVDKKQLDSARLDIREGAARLVSAQISPELSLGADASRAMYEAICLFYSDQVSQAHDFFISAAKNLVGGQRARALNNAGFASFVLGRLDDARADYNKAYEAQPNWPYIAANIAYLNMSEGKTKAALAGFNAILRDKKQAIYSPQDVRLARIMILEMETEGRPDFQYVNNEYGRILRDKSLPSWDFEVDNRVRYAKVVHTLVNGIYLGGEYFGLEMFALNHVCKAMESTAAISSQKSRDELLAQLRNDREIIGVRVGGFWKRNRHVGWLRYLNSCEFGDQSAS